MMTVTVARMTTLRRQANAAHMSRTHTREAQFAGHDNFSALFYRHSGELRTLAYSVVSLSQHKQFFTLDLFGTKYSSGER